MRAEIDQVTLVGRPRHQQAVVEDGREHGPVTDVGIAGEGRVVDEHVAFVDVGAERTNNEAQCRVHRADVDR